MMKKKLTGRLPVSAVHAAVHVALLATVVVPAVAQAQSSNTIFPEGWDRSVRERMFMRLGAISVNVKTKTSEATDVTGPVLTRQNVEAALAFIQTNPTWDADDELNPARFDGVSQNNGGWRLALSALLAVNELNSASSAGLVTPPGIKAKAGDSATVALSLGYWLTEDYKWMLEGFVLGLPLDVKIYGAGKNMSGEPHGLDGQHIVSTKLLPPTVVLSHHFGSRGSKLRPYLGVGAMYAVIYGAKTTPVYDNYVGGKTSVSVKNAFGVGPFLGLTGELGERWHLNLQVGQVNLKTEARLTTRNTVITTDSAVLRDFSRWGDSLDEAIETGKRIDSDIVTKVVKLVGRVQSNGMRDDAGSFTRQQKQKLRGTMVNVSLGYAF